MDPDLTHALVFVYQPLPTPHSPTPHPPPLRTHTPLPPRTLKSFQKKKKTATTTRKILTLQTTNDFMLLIVRSPEYKPMGQILLHIQGILAI